MKRISVTPEKCSGCRICELACAQYHFGVNNPKKAAIRIFTLYPNPVIRTPIVCRQCEDPECQKSCPSDAIQITDDIVKIDPELCTGCLVCVDACPYGAIFVHPDVDTPIKCDLCSGSPRCVEACPKTALVVVETLVKQPRLTERMIEYESMKEINMAAGDTSGKVIRYIDGGPSR